MAQPYDILIYSQANIKSNPQPLNIWNLGSPNFIRKKILAIESNYIN